MAKKKASPVKTVRPSGGKTVTKKSVVKKSSAKAATKEASTVKKTVVKKAMVKKIAAKKVTAKKKSIAGASKSSGKSKAIKPGSTEKKPIKDKVQLLADAAVEGILELKGRNITIMNLKNIQNRVCDYYIICQADSNTQVNAIAGSVEEIIKKKTGEKPYRSEGFQNSEWILVDYVTVVVHIFQTHIRNFYNLESLWADAEITELAFD